MELDCTMFDDVVFNTVEFGKTIIVTRKNGTDIHLDKYGTFSNGKDAKCVIFPKGKTTWEGFVPPSKFKDGDVVISSLGHIHILKNPSTSYIFVNFVHNSNGSLCKSLTTCVNVIRLATEEEKEKLFEVIKDNGYKWNEETKTLEKLPRFKVGDRIKEKQSGVTGEVTEVQQKKYNVKIDDNKGLYVYFREQDEWELVPNKFDIHTLVPFESRVLVRDSNKKWRPAVYGFCNKFETRCAFYAVGGCVFEQCIPYEGNEHLLGTTNDCDKYFKSWE